MNTSAEKVLQMIKDGHHSTPALYLAMFPQPVEDFVSMKQGLEEHNVVFELRGHANDDKKQYDLYLVDKGTDSMVLVATNAHPDWLKDRGFEHV